jgi:hypothetical protein
MWWGKAGAFPFRRAIDARSSVGFGRDRSPVQTRQEKCSVMKWLKKLNNPFLLGAQGFLVGAAIFFATHPEAAHRGPAQAGEQAKAESPRARA